MKTNTFEFVSKNSIVPMLNKNEDKIEFIKAILGGKNKFDWGDLAFELNEVKQQYEIVMMEEIYDTMICWPSYEEGLSNVLAQMSFANLEEGASFKEVVGALELDYKEYIKGHGQWCFWGEEEVIFYPSFKKLIDAWLMGDSIEPYLKHAKMLLKDVGYKKAELFAKQHAKDPKSNAYNTLEDFLIAADQKA